MLLPDRLFARAVLLRTLVIWPGVRVALVVAESAAASAPGGAPPSLLVPPLVAVGVAALVGGLTAIDARRRGEQVLLANLGTGLRSLVLLGFAIAAGLELLVALAGAMRGVA